MRPIVSVLFVVIFSLYGFTRLGILNEPEVGDVLAGFDTPEEVLTAQPAPAQTAAATQAAPQKFTERVYQKHLMRQNVR